MNQQVVTLSLNNNNQGDNVSKSKLKVGDTFQSTSGNTYSVIELLPDCKSRVKFNDEFGYETIVDNDNLSRGRIKNPYYRKIFGLGYFGVGPYKSKLGSAKAGHANTKEYSAWINMLSRCYYDKYIQRNTGNKTYEDAVVCVEWLNFQTFAKWFSDKYNPIETKEPRLKVALDKDILGDGSKLYSPETCSVIPFELNSSLIGCAGILIGEGKIGCRLNKNGKYSITLSRNGITRGVSKLNLVEDCFNVYMEHKRSILKELVEKYKHILELKVYEKLTQF